MKPRILIATAVVALFLLSSNNVLADVSLNIDPPTIHLDDTVRLTLTIDNIQNRSLPNLTALLSDFDIQSTERNISYTVINHEARSTSQWVIVLKPKKSGVLSIPPIHIGPEQSQPAKVIVEANVAPNVSSNKTIDEVVDSMLTTEVDHLSPATNEQVIYTVKLYNRQRLLDAQYQVPQVEDGLLIPLGEGRHYQTELHHQTYDVDEQQYAIFAQKEGALTIQPPAFRALTYDGLTPTRIALNGKPITLQVKSLPQTPYASLPAKHVSLTENYDWSGSTADEGSTITRIITLKAIGSVAQLLPTLTFKHNDEYRVYPDKPKVENDIRENSLVGKSVIQVAYLLSKPGHVTLPAIEVPWYNVVTKKNEMATLPSRTFVVNAVAASQQPRQLSKVPVILTTNKAITSPIKAYLALFGIVVVGLMLIAAGLYWYLRTPRKAEQVVDDPSKDNLRAACKSHDPRRVRAALLAFALKQWPTRSILNLNDIPIEDPDFKVLIQQLSAALYSNTATHWRADELWRYLSTLNLKQKKFRRDKINLPSIYPGCD